VPLISAKGIYRFDNPNQWSCLDSLVVFKYATNIREALVIDFILAIPHLKYCQITLVSPYYYHQSKEKCSSNLEGLDIDSKCGLPSSYFFITCSSTFIPCLRYLNVYLSCRDDDQRILWKYIDQLTYLSKLTLKINSTKLKHLYLLAQITPNLEYLKLDYSAGNCSQ
jgi:hypothetical protein